MKTNQFGATCALVLTLFACLAVQAQTPPYPPSPVINGVDFNWTTLKQLAPGSDNWPITWADDGHQYTSWGDGGGFGGTSTDGRVSLGVGRIEGTKGNYQGYNRWGGKDPEYPAEFEGKSFGIICIDGVLYMWVSPGSSRKNYTEVRMARSTDHGAHWSLSSWSFTSSQNLVIPTILQFGQSYAGARDTYVYHYFIHPSTTDSLTIQKPGMIYLARVPKTQMMTQSAYEFVSGFNSSGQPVWSTNVSSKTPVFRDSNNGVGWSVSASYNPGLQRYLLTTEHTLSYPYGGNIGIFDAPEPWGPWTTALFETPWSGTDRKCFYWNFSNKWLSADGKSFVLVFSGRDRWNTVEGTFTVSGNPPPSAPAAPTNLTVTGVTSSSVSLSWTANAESDLAGYRVYRSTTAGSGYSQVNAGLLTTPSFDDTSVVSASTYYYVVTAVNTGGLESPKSNEVTATVPVGTPTNTPPTANAGPDQTVSSGAGVTLQGSGSDPDGDALTFAWTQSVGPAVSLQGANTATASFTAPTVSSDTTLSFRLTVDDGRGGTGTDSVNVLVAAATSANSPPVADAGPDQTVAPGANVTLAGSGTDPDGDPLTYAWKQISGPTVSLAGANTATASFTAPTVTADTQLEFRLAVKDGQPKSSDADRVNVLVDVNGSLMASAGPDQFVLSGTVVTLNGSRVDPDGGEETIYEWEQISGPQVVLAEADTATPRFRAPKGVDTAELLFRLHLREGQGNTASDDCQVSVRKAGDLVLPFDLKQSEASLRNSFVGIALFNSSAEPNVVELAAVNESGEAEIMSQSALGPRSQDAFLAESVLLPRSAQAIRARDQSDSLHGFFLVGDGRPDRLDGVGSLMAPSMSLFFTLERDSRESTLLFLSNSEDRAATVSVDVVNSAGVALTASSLRLEPGASRLARLSDIMPSLPLTGEHYVHAASDVPIHGFRITAGPEHLSSISAQHVVKASTLWLPHFVVGAQGEETELRLINPQAAPVEARVKIYDDNGSLLTARLSEIPGRGLSVTRLSDLLKSVAMPPETVLSGHIVVEVFTEDSTLLGSATFTSTLRRARSVLPFWRQPQNQTVYLQVAQAPAEGIFTGLAIMNPNERTAVVKVEVFDQNGELSGRKDLVIEAGRRVVDLLDGNRLFGPAFKQTKGYLRVVSDRPVVGFVMFGDRESRFLSAVEGQPVME